MTHVSSCDMDSLMDALTTVRHLLNVIGSDWNVYGNGEQKCAENYNK